MPSKLFVGNLSYEVGEQDLRELFASVGEVTSVHIVTDRQTGRPRGFAFVEMASGEAAGQAVAQLNGRELHGRAIGVEMAREGPGGGGPRPDRGRGPGGFRDRGRGPRRGRR